VTVNIQFVLIYGETLIKRTERRREGRGSCGTESTFDRVHAKEVLCPIQ